MKDIVENKETVVVPFNGGNPTVDWVADNGAMLARHYFAVKGLPLKQHDNCFIMVETPGEYHRTWVECRYTSQAVYASLEKARHVSKAPVQWGYIKGLDTVYTKKFLDEWFVTFVEEHGKEKNS